MISRRTLIESGIAGALSAAACRGAARRRHDIAWATSIERELDPLERRSGGRLGVAAIWRPNGGAMQLVQHRGGERFGMCSTFKLPLAAMVLAAHDRRELLLTEEIVVRKEDMVPHAPVTAGKVGQAMTLAELCEATQTTSDNPAANLLLNRLGGPAAFTHWLRELGDAETRLDRIEPMLNDVLPGDPRDTTTPLAMAQTIDVLVHGNALQASSRQLLHTWLRATQTGVRRLRATWPASWQAGDKTGTSAGFSVINRYNDLAVAWLPDGTLTVAAYYEAPNRTDEMQAAAEAVLARVGSFVGPHTTTTTPSQPST